MSDHPRPAFITKYLGPTDHRGSRVKATGEVGSVTVSWDSALDIYDNHKAAAQALLDTTDWGGELIGGFLPEPYGYAFIVNSTAPKSPSTVEFFAEHVGASAMRA